MKRALVTGILGQDGAYLARLLLDKGYRVYGLIRRYTNPNFDNLNYVGATKDVILVQGDMTDECSIMNAVKLIQPEEIYNLAAQSFVGTSWDQATYTTQANALGTLHILNAMKLHCPTAKFYQASTSEMFGNASRNGLQDEETPFHPRSPYAISKLYAHWIATNFKESYGMFCACGILFNHESPIRGPEFVTRKITMAVAKIKLGLQKEIRLGTLDARRDWGFAGDYVEAMWKMLQQKEAENFIICTGETHSVREFLEEAFACVGITDWEKYIVIDPAYARPAEVHMLKGSSIQAQKKLDWKPKINFKELVKMMVEADVERLKTQQAAYIAPHLRK